MTTARASSDADALVALLALGEWNPSVGREVVQALEALGRRAVPALVEALRDPASGRVLRLAAVWLLGRAGGAPAWDALCRATLDADAEVATAASGALGLEPTAACDGALAA